jgi:2'-5' RNA ligase
VARLFVAVRPDQATRAVLDETLGVPRPDDDGVRWVPSEQWHITLGFWADADPDAISDALGSLTWLTATITLGPRITRLGRDAIVVPASGAEALADLARRVAHPIDQRPFTGHLTVARLRHRAAGSRVGAHLSSTFTATEVELVHSRLSASGAVHTTVGRWSTLSAP